ncbi:MAG: PDZ domain-containing protein, partial [Actinobacteria bacterium]|nr:PDZ domain-containing protein [Actinomycetota bacterium]
MKKKQPPYTSLFIGAGVIFAAGILLGTTVNNSSSTSILDEAVDQILDKTSNDITKKSLERAAIEGMLKSLGDKWSRFLPEFGNTSFDDSVEGQYSGIGIWLRGDDSGFVSIAGIVPSSPAEFANLENGDVIQSIDGVVTKDKTLFEISKLLTGEPNTNAILLINRNEETLTFSVERTELKSNPVQLKKLSNDIVVVSISEFNRGSARNMRAALATSGAH